MDAQTGATENDYYHKYNYDDDHDADYADDAQNNCNGRDIDDHGKGSKWGIQSKKVQLTLNSKSHHIGDSLPLGVCHTTGVVA